MMLTPFVGLDLLVGHRQVAVAAALGREVDDDRSGFIAATMSSVQSFGAGRPGISAVVMTMSISGASSRNLASCFSRNSGLDGAA